MKYSLYLPINGVSFGSASIAILRDIHKRGENPNIFLIGGKDLSAQKDDNEFSLWLDSCIGKANREHKKEIPTIKLWHLFDSLNQPSNKQYLITFYEVDSPTPEEVNFVKNNEKVIFTSEYSANIFKEYGCNNVEVIPLGFDSYNFHKKDKKYLEDRITFNLLGKFEHRKRTEKVIRAWIKKYGNNREYFLNCSVYNPFFSPEDNNKLLAQTLNNNKPFNVQFFNFIQKNEDYNDLLNAGNIVIAMSGGEGWGLGEFHSVAIGKHCVGLNAHGHKMWMNEGNSVLINPSGKIPAFDGIFFRQGQCYNQGNIFDWDEEEFINGCEEAIKRYKSNPINSEGLKLQENFTYKNTVDKLFNLL